MIYEVILDPTAEIDLDEIFKYYEGLREGLGFEFMLSFDSSMNSIANNPKAYFNINNQIRRIIIPRFPYAAFFSIAENAVHVHLIMHQHRSPEEWQKRIK
jgi:plasmid stabilization system protein ParE